MWQILFFIRLLLSFGSIAPHFEVKVMAFSLAILDEGITNATKNRLGKQTAFERDYLQRDFETDNGIVATHGNLVFASALQVSRSIDILDLKIGDHDGPIDGRIEAGLKHLLASGSSYDLAAINMSFSGPDPSVFTDEIAALGRNGAIVVASSGNDGTHAARETLPYPARLANVIAVGSHDGLGKPTAFSNNGPGVDILADGENVPRFGVDGTSFAAPQVAATVTHVQAIVHGLTGDVLDTRQMIDALQWGGAAPLSRPDPADGRSRYFLHDHAGTLDYAWSKYGGTPTRALEYVASHEDLIALIGADPDAGRRHFENHGSVEGRSITFDGLDCIASYDDLIPAFATDSFAGASHFIVTGAREGRMISFEGLDYIASHGDLIEAFGVQPDAGTAHFVGQGFAEGRARDLFDAAQYLANYADLRLAFVIDEEAATRHYVTTGYYEGRTDEATAATVDFML